jgi:RNA-directed DNA polymerase
MMNAREKSDSVIVAEKSSNKTGSRKVTLDTETMERRAEAKENAKQQSTRRAQNRESVKQALSRVRQAAKLRKKGRFTALFHHITTDLLWLSFLALKRDAAAGVDGVKWQLRVRS